MGGGWVLEVDIRSFFDELDHGHLRSFLDRRVRDGVIRRAIGKWLQAGVLEEGRLAHPVTGTPQGGVSHPCWPTCTCTKWWIAGLRKRSSPVLEAGRS
jgi:RNA-directed DNA polymerase